MDSSNRIIGLIVGLVVLTGVLTGGAAYWHTRTTSNAYDETLQTELEQKALAYSVTASAFLDTLGEDGLEAIQLIVQNASEDEPAADSDATSASQFSNAFQSFDVWLPDSSSPTGYSLLTRQELVPDAPAANVDVVETLLAEAAAADGSAATIDRQAQLILVSIPLAFDEETTAIGIGTLSARDEFAFFAAQKQAALRDGVLLSAAIVFVVALVAAALGWLIMRQRRRSDALRLASEERYRELFENANDIVYTHDLTGSFTSINLIAEQVLGYKRDELLTKNISTIVAPADLERGREMTARKLRGETTTQWELEIIAKDGHRIAVEVNTRLILKDGKPVGVQGIVRDISERKRAKKALEQHAEELEQLNERLIQAHQELTTSRADLEAQSKLLEAALEAERKRARRDPLTSVLNHGAIVDELRDLVSNSVDEEPHTVAMVDVDGLKAVNDTYGHQIGDAILTTIASQLSRPGTIVGRYGGDEFVVLLPNTDRAAAEEYRATIIESLKSAGTLDPASGATVPAAVSIGLAVYPDEATSVADLVALSDSAMYANKRQRPSASASPDGLSVEERATQVMGQIMPLLTSPGKLQDKLRLVADRLSTGAGYDGVNFMLYASALRESPLTGTTFARATRERAEAWIHEYRNVSDDPFRQSLERSRRPIIINNDPANDERFGEKEQKLVRMAKIRSLLIVPILWQNALIGSLTVVARRENAFGSADADLVVAVAAHITAFVRMATLADELQSSSAQLVQAKDDTVLLLAAAAEAHDHTTGVHLRSVQALAESLAREMGYGDAKAASLGSAAVLHDIGKFRVPDSVLADTDKLGDVAWEQMKQHTVWGSTFLAERPGFELATTVARSHHERWDGGGYPDGLVGEEIPEASTIVAVADAFDAMTHNRPYRAARSVATAIKEIRDHAGRQFSPRVVEALLRLRDRDALPSPDEDGSREDAA